MNAWIVIIVIIIIILINLLYNQDPICIFIITCIHT